MEMGGCVRCQRTEGVKHWQMPKAWTQPCRMGTWVCPSTTARADFHLSQPMPVFSESHFGFFSTLTLILSSHCLVKNLFPSPFQDLFPTRDPTAPRGCKPSRTDQAQLRISSQERHGRWENYLLNIYYLPLSANWASDLAFEKPILKNGPQKPLQDPKATGLLARLAHCPLGCYVLKSLL